MKVFGKAYVFLKLLTLPAGYSATPHPAMQIIALRAPVYARDFLSVDLPLLLAAPCGRCVTYRTNVCLHQSTHTLFRGTPGHQIEFEKVRQQDPQLCWAHLYYAESPCLPHQLYLHN